MTGEVRTTCPYCGVGCGVRATVRDAGVEIAGDKAHPANHGRLCSKGAALAETLSLDDRLLHPIVDGVRANWDTALFKRLHFFKKCFRRKYNTVTDNTFNVIAQDA